MLISTFCAAALSATGDSLNYLTPKDTVFIKLESFGYKFLYNEMEKGQTLNSLARFYGLKPDAVYAFNPQINRDEPLPPNLTVRIPVPDSAIIRGWVPGFSLGNLVPVCYVVRQGDTFYRIAKVYFKVDIDTLKMRNHLTSDEVRPGMCLHIGWISVEGIPDSLQLNNISPAHLKMMQLQAKYEAAKSKTKPQAQNGAAYWQREKKGDVDDFYVLHRFAPIGSVVQIKNPLKGKVAYAEVIGKIPDQAYGDDIVAVLSPPIARLLGAKDPKFFVEIKYFK